MVTLHKLIYRIKIYLDWIDQKKILGHLDEIEVVDFDYNDIVKLDKIIQIVKAYSQKQNND